MTEAMKNANLAPLPKTIERTEGRQWPRKISYIKEGKAIKETF